MVSLFLFSVQKIAVFQRGVDSILFFRTDSFYFLARYDCTIVQQTMDAEEPLPGVTPATVRAIRNAYATKQENERKAREPKLKGMRNPYQALNAAVAAAAGVSGGGSGGGSSAVAAQGLSLPQPVSASPRERYPCHGCGVRGHWKGDGSCKPEDVRAHIARLSAMIAGQGGQTGQLALPPPTGMSQFCHKEIPIQNSDSDPDPDTDPIFSIELGSSDPDLGFQIRKLL